MSTEARKVHKGGFPLYHGRMNVILVERDELDDSGCVELSGRRGDHVRTVLRARVGDRLRVGRVEGPLGEATVEHLAATAVRLRCRFDLEAPPRPTVDLLLALPRPKVLKRLYAPLAQLGLGRLLLVNAAKVERMYFDSHVLDPAFQRERLLEGLQQARDTRLPEVTLHRRLKVLLEDELDACCPDGERLWADPAGGGSVYDAVQERCRPRVLLAVGPEGGWTAHEAALFAAAGFRGVSAGPRVLSSDVACITMIALVADALRQPLKKTNVCLDKVTESP